MEKYYRNYWILILMITVFCVSTSFSQQIQGLVKDENQEPVFGATVILNEKQYVLTNGNGGFVFNVQEKAREHQIKVKALGFKTYQLKIRTGSKNIQIVLKENKNELEAIVLNAKTNKQIIEDSGYNVDVVSAQKLKNTTVDLNQILKTVPGINIRESGGLGSEFQLSLNGLSGNQVRTFINGVPMEYFGSSLSLNNFPANLVEDIQVYKGVVPVGLSADALGGAINIVTSKLKKNYLDVSYSYGSFKTSRASINSQWIDKKSGFISRIKSFYNASHNDYEIDVKLINEGKEDEKFTTVKRFNDAYNSKMIWGEIGFIDKKIADEALFGFMYSDNFKQIQQPEFVLGTTRTPLGSVFTEEEKKIYNFSYSKKGLFSDRLKIRAYTVFVDSEKYIEDIGDDRYDWLGNKEVDAYKTRGELEGRKTKFTLSNKNILGNLNAKFNLAPHSNIDFSTSLNYIKLQGNDPLKAQVNTQFKDPSKLKKLINSIAYNSEFYNGKLKSTLFYKNYNYNLKSVVTNYSGDETNPFESNKKFNGYGFASTYFFRERLQLKMSFEKAIRFPDVRELFGNGQLLIPNPELKPETSINCNLGLNSKMNKSKIHQIKGAFNLFVRNSKDFTRIESTGVLSRYRNQTGVLTKGIDASLGYRYKNIFVAQLNSSYQDLRNNEKWVNGIKGGQIDPLYNDKIPNIPDWFGNLSLNYTIYDFIKKNSTLILQNQHSYVRQFFKLWESLAETGKPKIPAQYTTDISAIYSSVDKEYNISLTVNNIFSQKVYDNFEQQKPGRAFYIKLRYYLN